MGFKIEGINELDRTLKKTAKEIKATPSQIVKSLSTVRNNILNTTKGGIDINGNQFKEYSASYKEFRSKHHRQKSPVSLTYTGDMLRGMGVFNIANGGEIKFKSTNANNKAVKNNSTREFFGLNQSNEDYIMKIASGSISL